MRSCKLIEGFAEQQFDSPEDVDRDAVMPSARQARGQTGILLRFVTDSADSDRSESCLAIFLSTSVSLKSHNSARPYASAGRGP